MSNINTGTSNIPIPDSAYARWRRGAQLRYMTQWQQCQPEAYHNPSLNEERLNKEAILMLTLIAALKRANAAYEEAKHGISVDLDVDIHYDISLKCVCGKYVEVSGDIYSSPLTDTDDAVAHDCDANDIVATCYHCGQKYRIETDDDGNLKAFLKDER